MSLPADRIKVLQVVWRLSVHGGAPMVVRELLRNIDHDRFEMHLCTIRPLAPDERLADLGAAVRYHPLGLTGPPTPPLRTKGVIGVLRTVRAVDPDVLHVHSGTASYSLLASLRTHPTARIIEVHDAPQSGRLSEGNRRLERWMHRRRGFRPVVHSRAVRSDVASAWQLDVDEIPLVPLGIDVDALDRPLIDRASVRRMLGVPEDAPLVLYVARLVPEKRPELFLAVAAEVARRRPEVRFALVGSGSELQRARELAATLGIGDVVSIPGFVDDLASVYHAADVFLSTSRYEGFGLAIAEAMACGLPVVSTDVGGVSDVIGEAGILVDSAQPSDLASELLASLAGDRPRSLAAASRERALSHLDVRTSARSFEHVYRRAVEP